MKAVLMSIQPKWVEKIASGEKTIEVRKTKPKLETPFKVYIYCTKPSKKYQTICGCMVINTDELYRLPNGEIKHDWSGELMCCNGEYTRDNFLHGKVIGEFVCDKIDEYKYRLTTYEGTPNKGKYISKEELAKTCLSIGEINDYLNGKNGYAWHISDLKIYDKPKELSEFKKQNVCYKSGDWETLGCWEGGCVQQELGECDGRCSVLERPPQSWCYVEV